VRDVAWATKVYRASKRIEGAPSWIIALTLFAASLSVRYLADPWLTLKFVTFYPAIAASALLCGWRQGMLVMALSALAGWYFFFEPHNSFLLREQNALFALIGFLLVGGFLLILVSGMADLIRRLEAANQVQVSLFGELQHRVANNLQIVLAMISSARRGMPEGPAAERIAAAEDRIAAMSTLHRRLYDKTTYEQGLAPILREMLLNDFGDLPIEVAVDIAPDAKLSLDQMTAALLLINEAALNATKHVFEKGQGSKFEVALLRLANGHLQLIVRDDGPGIMSAPAAASGSLGMNIMQAFARQLGGSLEMEASCGTTLMVEFSAE
jgi:two-component sensor histidine kinase